MEIAGDEIVPRREPLCDQLAEDRIGGGRAMLCDHQPNIIAAPHQLRGQCDLVRSDADDERSFLKIYPHLQCHERAPLLGCGKLGQPLRQVASSRQRIGQLPC